MNRLNFENLPPLVVLNGRVRIVGPYAGLV